MSNANLRLLIGSGMAIAGVVLICTAKGRGKHRSLFSITRKQAGILADQARRQAARIGDAAVEGLADAVEAGKAAYQRVAS
jgi:hypothetical protein